MMTRLADRLPEGIRQVDDLDAAPLAEFMARHYGALSRQVAPAIQAWRTAAPKGVERWVCIRTDKIVGHQALLPFTMAVGNLRHDAAWAIDLMVDPSWRLRGVGPTLSATALAGHPIVAGLGIADAAQKAFRRAGWVDLGNVPRWLRLLAPIPETLGGKRLALLSRLAAPPLAVADRVAAAGLWLAGIRTRPEEEFGPWSDQIWERCRHEHGVIALRDNQTLGWRFDRNPDAELYRRFALTVRGRPVGYFVLRESIERKTGIRRGLLVDFLCPRVWEIPLLILAISRARNMGLQMLSLLAPDGGQGEGRQLLGFIRRPGQHLMLHLGKDAPDIPTQQHAWFVTFADSDLDHLPAPDDED